MNASETSRVLVVGAGSIGERHLRCFQQTGRARVAVCEPSEELRNTIGDRYQVGAYKNMEEALRGDAFDGVVLCTPAHLHVPMAQTALRAGSSVLIEKPLGTSLDGLEELLRLRNEHSLTAAVAYVLRFTPSIKQAREFLLSGEIGPPLHAVAIAGQHFPSFRPSYRNTYYTRHETGGGAIQDALTHNAHTMEWLLGPTGSLFCDAAHQFLDGVEVEDTVNVAARNGRVPVSYALNQFQAPSEGHIWVHCEEGSIKIELHRNRWGVLERGREHWTWHEAPVKERDVLFRAQANAFLDALRAGENATLCSLEEGIQTLKFNLAALESAQTGSRALLHR